MAVNKTKDKAVSPEVVKEQAQTDPASGGDGTEETDAEEKAKADAEEKAKADAEEKDEDKVDPEPDMVPVLDSPQPFGIYIDYGKGQILKRFQKGKTVLTELEAKALEAHQYTKDNGAEIIFKKNPNKK